MKKLFILLLSGLVIISAVGCSNVRDYPYKADYTELGIPLKEYYAMGTVSRCAWDIEVYNNRLYVGSGDYDKNSGPVNMFYYDIKNKEWVSDGVLPDEEISRLFIFEDKLVASGIDPKDNWDYGNFYSCDTEGWKTNRNIPGGIHNFDMVNFDGKLFAGLGVQPNEFPVAVSVDGGKHWEQVPFYKNGKPINDVKNVTVRVYDFFVHQNRLYAHYRIFDGQRGSSEIYVYDNGVFNFYSLLLSSMSYHKTSYHYLNQKLEFNKKQFIAMGNLYVSNDMITAEQIKFKPNINAVDLKVINDTLYVLCNEERKSDDGTKYFRVSVWFSKTGNKGDFSQMFFYDYENRALSFTYHNGIFYFGIGYGVSAQNDFYDTNGMILSVKNKV